MSRLLLAAAVLAVLVYTMVLGVHWLSPRIEKDISDRVITSMAERGLLWADVTVHGRVVTVSGDAPTEQAKESALSTAASVFGVAKVEDKLTVTGQTSGTTTAKAAKPKRVEQQAAEELAEELAKTYNLTITKEGDDVKIAGNVPDEASKNMLVRLAIAHYNGASHVNVDELKIVAGAPAGWRSAVGAMLMHMTNLEQAKVMISGTEVMVSGTVLSRQFSDQMEKAVKQVLPTKYKVAFAVDVVTPTTPMAKVKAIASEAMTTEPAAKVEPAAGCDTASIKKAHLNFAFDKAEITEAHKETLNKVAKTVESCKTAVVVAGYTDTTGSYLYNRWLSQQRAEAGMRGLMREGVNEDNIRAVGYGQLHPVASNKTREGRSQNRRVEFVPGTELPYPLPGVRHTTKAAKHTAAKAEPQVAATVVKQAISPELKARVEAEKAAAAKGVKPVSPSAIRKPWWAIVETKTTTATSDTVETVNKAVDHMLQPQPTTTVKQPPLAK